MDDFAIKKRVYVTFLTSDEPFKDGATQNDLTKYIYGENNTFFISENLVSKKEKTSYEKGKDEKYYGIRPVIRTTGFIESFLKENSIKYLDNDEYPLGFYPSKIIYDKHLISKLKDASKCWDFEYHIPVNDEVKRAPTFTYNGEKYAYFWMRNNGDDVKVFVKVKPLIWKKDSEKNILICKDIIAGFYTDTLASDFEYEGYNFLNQYFLNEILDDKINSIFGKIEICNETLYDEINSFYLPYEGEIVMDSNGKLYSLDEKEYDINISNAKVISSNASSELFKNSFKEKATVNINIEGDDVFISSHAFDFSSSDMDVIFESININAKTISLEDNVFCKKDKYSYRGAYSIKMPCDFKLFTSLYLSGNKTASNLFRRAYLTISYTSEKELISFLKDVQRITDLFTKIADNYYKNAINYKYSNNKIDFIYKHELYKFSYCDFLSYGANYDSLFNKIGATHITFEGPKINTKKALSFFEKHNWVKFNFINKTEKKENISDNQTLTKEAQHILDLVREIMSIEYIGIDKNQVKQDVNEIILEYNSNLKVSEGLSLSSNNMLYTNTILKLENYKDTLYHNFEEKIGYYDILDLIENMIKKLNGEEVKPNYEILKDLDTLANILKYSKDDNTKNEIISYLESEKQNIIDYLCGKKEIDYNGINSFIRKFRIYLVPILTKVSGNVSKIDVLDNIKNYALNEMNNKTKENTNSYIKMLLSEIDKIKKEILLLDPSYTFNGIDYSLFSSGKEIIDYLENLYKKYYRVYLDLLYEKEKMETLENSKVPLIK